MKRKLDKPTESSMYIRFNILTLSVAPSWGESGKNTINKINIKRKIIIKLQIYVCTIPV